MYQQSTLGSRQSSRSAWNCTNGTVFRRQHCARRPRRDEANVFCQVASQTEFFANSGKMTEVVQQFRVGFLAEQGLREGMEDELHVAFNPTHGYLYAGCYDGHGGTAAVQWMKANLLDAITADLQKQGIEMSASNAKLREGLAKAFQAADDQLLSHLETCGEAAMAETGSTATVMLLWRSKVVVANVGDSQAYIWRKGEPLGLTTPHRVYGLGREVEDEIDRVKSTGGWVYDGRVCNVLAVSRAFGDWEFKGKGLPKLLLSGVERGYWPESFAKSIHFKSDPVIVTPATSDTQLTQDDEFLVLSTDGLWDVMPPRDAMKWARQDFLKGSTPQQVAESLVKIALKRYTSDNVSVVVVDLKGAEYWKEIGTKQGGIGNIFGGFFKR